MTHDDSKPGDENVDETSAVDEPVEESTDSDPVTEDAATDGVSGDDSDADDSTEAISLKKLAAADDEDAAETADEATADEDTADEDDADQDEPSARSPFSSLALALAVAALVGAIVCAGYFGYTGIRAYTVDSARDTLRTESVDAAEQAVLNITTVDPSDSKAWKKRLESSLTGDALKQVSDEIFTNIEQQVASSTQKPGKIESVIARSAATEVDSADDRAIVLVYANVKAISPTQPVGQSQMGFLLTMVDVDGVRKAEKVVPLQTIMFDDTQSPIQQAPGAPAPTTTAPAPEGGN